MIVRGRKKRQARHYSQGFLFIVLTGICLWHAFLQEDGLELYDATDPDAAARRLVDPPDHFTLGQRRHGAVIFHCIGLLYMFVAIAIVCDECFVPALEVITEVLEISPDVAGATFMAAGGSAPEFFTSLVGAIVTESDIGTGTIIGSAVFNVLFVIGACAIFANEPLKLTWFPLARDSCFYAVDLIVVTCAFLDEKVEWHEALILFCLYLAYIAFMKHSSRIEAYLKGKQTAELEDEEGPDAEARWAKSRENSEGPVAEVAVGAGTGEGGAAARNKLPRANSGWSVGQSPSGEDKTKCFRHKSMRVANHMTTIKNTDNDELHRESSQDALATNQNDSTGGSGGTGACVVPEDLPNSTSFAEMSPKDPKGNDKSRPSKTSDNSDLTGVIPRALCSKTSSKRSGSPGEADPEEGEKLEEEEEEEDDNEPLNLNPPGEKASPQDWIYYVVSFPIVFCLVCTVPDVRREGYRNYFVLTFAISILWIAAFTWAMVWFATVIAETCAVEEHIMGLTILAAGTSVPDLLTSVLVAREGHGDMAISSSIGSNIFDVTVGLPIPWLLYGWLNSGKAVMIKNEGLEISVLMLLAMLGITIGCIMYHGWVMSKVMGFTLMFLYLIFEVVSVGLTFAPSGSLKLIHV